MSRTLIPVTCPHCHHVEEYDERYLADNRELECPLCEELFMNPQESGVRNLGEAKMFISSTERKLLLVIQSTDGMEWNCQDDDLDALRDRGLVSFSGKRGPGGVWYRVELTKEGEESLEP